MERLTTIRGVRDALAPVRASGGRIGLVPTMGALHAGHLSLVEQAASLADVVVVSIFVNPTQFGPNEDLDSYPRRLADDEAALVELGAAAPAYVFAPEEAEIYPQGAPATRVTVAGLSDVLCGRSRPTHFQGVTTVVAKLCNIVRPHVALFGRKDFQQLAILRQMVADLDMQVEVVGGPTVRDPDGVAMSSRNDYLDHEQRKSARALSRALAAAVHAADDARTTGASTDPDLLRRAATDILRADPGATIDYVEVLDPVTLTPPDSPPSGQRVAASRAGQAPDQLLVAVAAYVGPARLIDNVVVGDSEDEERLLAATGM